MCVMFMVVSKQTEALLPLLSNVASEFSVMKVEECKEEMKLNGIVSLFSVLMTSIYWVEVLKGQYTLVWHVEVRAIKVVAEF